MTISAGTRLGPYEIVVPIGAGGMGEVWRGRDTRLERSVAIKVLPAEFAENAQFKLRFEREAKTISQLNHPHICTLYDVGEAELSGAPAPSPASVAEAAAPHRVSYLVMELLEGETLADRLAKGPLPIDQVLKYGVQIAGALDKAHKAGVVHRDLKPSNIMITKSGAKLLDFGLAKPAEGGVLSELTSLRTEKKNLTEEGTIIGTFQYMAPEQIEGGQVDARTDIFALGALLYEMATGRRAFEGKSKASLIASILTAEPQPVSAVQPMTPASFDRLVRNCLQKDPDERWQSAHDVATELRGIGSESATPAVRRRASSNWLPWTIAALAAIAALAVILQGRLKPPVNAVTTRFLLNAPAAGTIQSFAISPDGNAVAMAANDAEGRQVLWIRKRNAASATVMPRSDNAHFPFWSPDSRFVGYFADGALKRIDTAGGAPQILCPSRNGRGGTWNQTGDIVFAASGAESLSRVSANGGTPKQVTALDPKRGESTHRWPVFLPDGRHFLYLVSTFGSLGEKERFGIYAGSVDSSTQKFLMRADSNVAYADGYLFFARQSTLYAIRFDADRLEVSGEPIPIADGVRTQQQVLWSEFAVNPELLLYQVGAATGVTRLAWFGRKGEKRNAVADLGSVGNPRISPDGGSVAFDLTDLHSANSDIYVLVKDRPTPRRITFESGAETQPVWSPDGRAIYFNSWRARISIARVGADGKSQEYLYAASLSTFPLDVTSDGRNLLVMNFAPERQYDLSVLSLVGLPTLTNVVATAASETDARISPDGKMLAYTSNESGRPEIFLTSFPGGAGKWQVSEAGGSEPRWRRDGRELYYIDLQKRIVAADVRLTNPPDVGMPHALFRAEIRDPISGNDNSSYDVSADGQAFVVNVTDPIANDTISAVLNWRSELPRK